MRNTFIAKKNSLRNSLDLQEFNHHFEDKNERRKGDYRLDLAFVLRIELQQGHLKPSTVMNKPQNVHLFWPYSYLEPFGILSPLKSSQNPLQTNPIIRLCLQSIDDNMDMLNILRLIPNCTHYNIF